MSSTAGSRRTDYLALLGGFISLFDTVWGSIIVLGLDLSRMSELALGASFVLTFPAYILDIWIDRRITVFLPALFLFRWAVLCLGGPAPVLCNPLRGSILLIVALVLLQTSKLRTKA